MSLKSLFYGFLLACIAPVIAQPAALPTVAVPPEIESVLRAYERAWAANDANALARLFTADGMALPNGSPPAKGPAAITDAYSKAAGSPLALRAIDFHQTQDLATIVGGFAPAANQPDVGKFVLVLRRGGDGQWRIAADIDNMNARPQRPPLPQPGRSPAGGG
ncbi:YybH family protein [Aquabacterium humicola]|uniref:YybH family protein n=1 Tax=Aquabacterium humicola TaxID=3237377 RepID=UPI00254393F1|nr:nuclear transport factor 2 family protein [Rubrivivax pictus]